MLEKAGLVGTGVSPDGQLVEVCEIAGHPFMVGSQFHPEFRSRPLRPHPLFREFISAAMTFGAGEGVGEKLAGATASSDVSEAVAGGGS